jgi:hypothetical protein
MAGIEVYVFIYCSLTITKKYFVSEHVLGYTMHFCQSKRYSIYARWQCRLLGVLSPFASVAYQIVPAFFVNGN